MSRKDHHQDKSGWRLPTIYTFVGGYGPYKAPNGKSKAYEPIEDAIVILWNSGSSNETVETRQRHPMYSLAGELQKLLLDDDNVDVAGQDKKIFVIDLQPMFEGPGGGSEETSPSGKENIQTTTPSTSPSDAGKRKNRQKKTPTTVNTCQSYTQALKREEETVELTKGFGKVILKLLQRMLFSKITLVANGAPLVALLWKLHAALQVTDPSMIATMWMVMGIDHRIGSGGKSSGTCSDSCLSTKFCKTQLRVKRSAFSSTQQDQTTPLHVLFPASQHSRVEMLRYFFPHGSTYLVSDTTTHANWIGPVLLGNVASSSFDDPTNVTSSSSYDPDCINALGKSLFLSVVTVEMNRYTKQYQRTSVDITSDLLAAAVVVETKDTPVISPTTIDWSSCEYERHVGALVLRGNRCVLTRSLDKDKQWNDGRIRIPSVKPKENESPIQTAKRAVVEFTGVDEAEVQEMSALIQPVNIFGPNGRPILVQLIPLYATEPPPDGPLEDQDMEDDESPYDWYLHEKAIRKLDYDRASMEALQIMALSLIQAANVGLVPAKWGGVFGQEMQSLGMSSTAVSKDDTTTATTASPSSSVSSGSNCNIQTPNYNSMLQVEIEEWNHSGQSSTTNPDAALMKEVHNANRALLKQLEKQRQGGNVVSGKKKLPVTLLSGFLGSGKTTLLAHILSNSQGLKVAVLVNDMGEINIDAAILKQNSHISIQQRQEHMVELSNGCICCTLREDLLTEVAKIAASEECYDYLVIESSGISEPLPVAETFTFEDSESGLKLGDVAQLDTLVTVIDGARFFTELNSLESLQTRNWHADPEDQRTISHLLCDQVEFSNVIVLNKCDRIERKERATVKGLLSRMNPTATIVESTFGQVPLDKMLGTGLFSMEKAEEHEGWLQEARIGEHTPETEEYGISSFTYRARRPFYPHKFHQVLQGMLDQFAEPFVECKILRAKGFVWLTSCHQLQGDFSLAGNQVSLLPGNPWWAEIDKADWPENLERDIAPLWREPYGDRQQEVVWIGQSLDQQAITSVLNECLVSDEDLKAGQDVWNRRCEEKGAEDPFQEDWQTALDDLMAVAAHGQNHGDGHSHSHSHDHGAHGEH